MRMSVVIISGLTILLSIAGAQAKSNQPQVNAVPIIRPNSGQFRVTGSNIRWNGQTIQDQQTQPSPSDKQAPQVRMPSGDEKSIVQDVPTPPGNGGQQQIGPALQVQSNAATMPDECYERSSRCQLGEPIKIFGQTPGGLEIGGWSDTGYHSDNDGIWNNRDDKYNLNQFWLYAEKKAPRCCNSFGFGFRADAIYGVDAQDLQAFGNPPAGTPDGWDNDWDYGAYGWAIPQAYGEIARGNWSMKAGKYLNPGGYEQSMSPQNFFFSHSFAFGNILPRSFTGTLSSHRMTEDTTLYTGVTTNWDTGFNRFNDSLNYIGGFAYKPCAPVNVTGFAYVGDTGYREDGWTQDLFFDVMLTDKLNYIGEWTFENSDTANQFSLAHYFIYRVNPCLGLGSRFEWFKSTIYTGTADSTYSWTTGINFRRHANVVIRPELRVDWGEGAIDPGQPIFASDLIITF